MKTLEDRIKDINAKLQLLIKKYAALQKENSSLSEKLNEYRTKENSVQERITLLEIETSILKASAGKMNETEKMGFEKQINQYIKDLENCMTMLNK